MKLPWVTGSTWQCCVFTFVFKGGRGADFQDRHAPGGHKRADRQKCLPCFLSSFVILHSLSSTLWKYLSLIIIPSITAWGNYILDEIWTKIHGIRQYLSVNDTLWPHYPLIPTHFFHSSFIHKMSKLAYAISAETTKSQQLLMLMWTRTAKLILLSASYPFACLVLLCNVRTEWLSRGRFCGCWDWLKSMCHVAGGGLQHLLCQTQHGGQWWWRGQWRSQSWWAFSKLHRKQLLSTVQPHFTLMYYVFAYTTLPIGHIHT